MPVLLKAKAIRDRDFPSLVERTRALVARGLRPSLRVVLVGDDPAGILYTKKKKAYVESFGGDCEILALAAGVGEREFLATVAAVGADDAVHGLLVQMPLPSPLGHIDVGRLIPVHKDVDGLCPGNIYGLVAGDEGGILPPCTPRGIVSLLEGYGIGVGGRHVVVVGRSLIVGKPLAYLLTNRDATVTLCHSRTDRLERMTAQADIIVSAVGRRDFIGPGHIGPKRPVVVDVGINRDGRGKLCGDVDFERVAPLACAITPVPGGVGPMTVHTLAQNLLTAAERSLR